MMNLDEITQRLLRYKVATVILIVVAVTLPIVVAQDLMIKYLGRFGPIVVALASAGLTSALVGLFFELLVHIEVVEMFKAVLLESEERLVERLVGPAPDEKEPLTIFWKPFVIERTTIFVAQDELVLDGNVEPDEIIRAADVTAAVELYMGLLQRFIGIYPYKDIRVDIGTIRKRDHPDIVTARNLIVIGAPGANPLANALMARLAGIDETEPEVKTGYVFMVDPKRPYLSSPFVVPAKKEQIGICDRLNGEQIGHTVPRRWTRWDAPDNEDCALIVHGMVGLTSDQARRVLIFAGHSRRGTLEAVNFASENTDWARKIKNMGNINTESLLRTRWKAGRPETYLVSIREIRWQGNRG